MGGHFSVTPNTLRTREDEEKHLKQRFFEVIEKNIALLNGSSIVKMAREDAKSANQYTAESTPFLLGYLLNPAREILDPYASQVMDWPRFSHDLKIRVIQRNTVDGYEEVIEQKVRHSGLTDNPPYVTRDEGYDIVTDRVACGQAAQLEVQITYEALVEVGLPNVKVYLFELPESLPHDRVAQAARTDYKQGGITYIQYLARIYGPHLDQQTTDKKGHALFQVPCKTSYRNAKKRYIIVSILDDPEANIKKLYALYDLLQQGIANRFNHLWSVNKPLWNNSDFFEIRRDNTRNFGIGIGQAIQTYVQNADQLAYNMFKTVWQLLYNPGGFINELINIEKESSVNIKKENSNIKDYLTKLGVTIDDIKITFEEYRKQYNRITQFLADEAAVFFVVKSLLLYCRTKCDKDFQALVCQTLPKIMTSLVVGIITMAAAKRIKIPGTEKMMAGAMAFILVNNLNNLVDNILLSAKFIQGCVEDLELFEELFRKHFGDAEETNVLVKTHSMSHWANSRNPRTSDEWDLISIAKSSSTINVNIPNTPV